MPWTACEKAGRLERAARGAEQLTSLAGLGERNRTTGSRDPRPVA
jgi:hypothetical protein